MRAERPDRAAQIANRAIVKGACLLVALLSVPVIGLVLLQLGVFAACSDVTIAKGVEPGHLQWRVTKMQCRNGVEAFYDVAIGAEGEPLSTALTSRGAPIPVGVARLEERVAGVKLDRPRLGTGEEMVRVKLRRSGSPSERVDLQADRLAPAN